MRIRLVVIVVLALLVLGQLALGVQLLSQDLGEVLRYGDTIEYLRTASGGRLSAARAPLYPLVIRANDAVRGHERSLRTPASWERRDAGEGLVGVQLLQLALCAASLAYFLAAVVGPAWAGSARRAGLVLLWALVWLDPLVVHHGLAIMPDSLALSGSLLFCAGFADYLRRRTPPIAAGVLLVAGQSLASGVRIEKNLVTLATAIVATLLFALASRRGAAPPGVARRAAAALLLSALAFGVIQLGQARVHRGFAPTILSTALLNQRLVYPHLTDIYHALPEATRKHIHRQQAELYDRSIQRARKVLKVVSRDDPELRRELTYAFVRTALAERWLPLFLDMGKDAGENFLATASFYGRLAARRLSRTFDWRVRFNDGVSFTLKRLGERRPRLVAARLTLSAVLLLSALGAALAGLRLRGPRGASAGCPDLWIAWVPVGAFCLVDGAAFALAQDLVLVRYSLFSHVAFLTLVYAGALRWAYTDGRPWKSPQPNAADPTPCASNPRGT